MISRCFGRGPKNFTPRGFKRISSKPSLKHVANNRARFLASFRRFLYHIRQWGQRVRGDPGRYNNFARKASMREDMLPPGQHRSPGCLTFWERLFKIRHGVLEKPVSQWLPSKNSTEEVIEGSVTPFEKIRLWWLFSFRRCIIRPIRKEFPRWNSSCHKFTGIPLIRLPPNNSVAPGRLEPLIKVYILPQKTWFSPAMRGFW